MQERECKGRSERGWDPELEREVFDTLSILAGGKIGVNPYTVRFVDLGVGREDCSPLMSSIFL